MCFLSDSAVLAFVKVKEKLSRLCKCFQHALALHKEKVRQVHLGCVKACTFSSRDTLLCWSSSSSSSSCKGLFSCGYVLGCLLV